MGKNLCLLVSVSLTNAFLSRHPYRIPYLSHEMSLSQLMENLSDRGFENFSITSILTFCTSHCISLGVYLQN